MLLERLKSGTRNTKEVDFYKEKVRIRLLSEAELQQTRIEATRYSKENELDDQSLIVEKALRQIYLAVTDLEGNPLAKTMDTFRNLLIEGEREFLVEEYLFLEQDCLPAFKGLSDNEFNELLEEVKKSPDSVLNSGNIYTLRRLVRYLENLPSN